MTSAIRRRSVGAAFAIALVCASVPASSSAAAAHQKQTGTIAAPAGVASAMTGGGNFEGVLATPQVRLNCPTGGALDGVVWKFFDLERGYTKFKATGPAPAVTEQVPATPLTDAATYNEYDIDLYLFDAKCNRVDAPTGSTKTGRSTAGTEEMSVKKPATSAAIVYFTGPYPDLPVQLEYWN